MKTLLSLILGQFIAFTAYGQTYSVLKTNVYDSDLKTVQLYPASNSETNASLNSAVYTIGSGQNMILEFDDMRASYRQFHVKIQHCDYEWQPTVVRDLEYLNDYNDFIINDYQVSQNTKINYYHYGFALPEIKLAGNYVLLLYEDYISEEPLAELRFRVLAPKVGVTGNITVSDDPSLWRTHQQVNFEINYGNYQVRNPRTDFKIIIRQNFRDGTIRDGFLPSMVNAAQGRLSFRFFDNQNAFPAGNEFRFTDLRSTFNKGYNVAEYKQGYEDEVWLEPQNSRADKTYLESRDLNGRFMIETLEDGHPSVSADYVHTFFGFKSLELAPEQGLYVLGSFNNFKCSPESELHYEDSFGGYTRELLLKQGLYDFQFAIKTLGTKPDFSLIEGNFSNTQNSYEVFVYHKPPTSRSEILVGYALIESR